MTTPQCPRAGSWDESGTTVQYGQTINVTFPNSSPPFNASFGILTRGGGMVYCWYDRVRFNDTNYLVYEVAPLNNSGLPTDEDNAEFALDGHGLVWSVHNDDDPGQSSFSEIFVIANSASPRRSLGLMSWSCIAIATLAALGGGATF